MIRGSWRGLMSDLHAVLTSWPLGHGPQASLSGFLLVHVHTGVFTGVLRPWPEDQGVLVRSMSDLHAVLTF